MTLSSHRNNQDFRLGVAIWGMIPYEQATVHRILDCDAK